MNIQTAWQSLAQAIVEIQRPDGDYQLKLDTVSAGLALVYEHPPEQILEQARLSPLPTRALVSWLVFEGGRLPGVEPTAVATLRALYADTCPPGEELIPPPDALHRQPRGNC